MASWNITEKINQVAELGYTPEWVSANVVTIYEGDNEGTWQARGRGDLSTFNNWFDELTEVRFTKQGGQWAIAGLSLEAGQTVTVSKKNGTKSEVKVVKVIGQRGDKKIASFENVHSDSDRSWSYAGRRRYGQRKQAGGRRYYSRTHGEYVTEYENGMVMTDSGTQLWENA